MKKLQRLERRLVGCKLLAVETVSTLLGKAKGEEIVCPAWKHAAVPIDEVRYAVKSSVFTGTQEKEIPFRHKFQEHKISDPKVIFNSIHSINEKQLPIEGIIIDTITFMMDQFKSKHVLTSADGFGAWEQYGEFFRNLIQDKVVNYPGTVIMTAHTETIFDKEARAKVTRIPVSGSLAKNGLEAFFTINLSAKKLPIDEVEKYKNPLLTVTEDERLTGVKNVFQTRLTPDTIGERIRSPKGMWAPEFTYIDNDIAKVMEYLDQYYGTK